MTINKQWFQKGYRRLLVDMHITDWDSEFLKKYSPEEIVKLYKKSEVSSVMFYAQSHVGLCYWPTKTGKQHQNLLDRDLVREMLELLKKENINSCVYYSVIFNNEEFLRHPNWRMVDAAGKPYTRYGHCCPNNPEYRQFCLDQVDELLDGYDFDSFFYDMTFWPRICVCSSCTQRYLNEANAEIPETIDWCTPQWCKFQKARERWIIDFTKLLTEKIKKIKPDISVYHNFSTALANWIPGLSFEAAKYHDFLGADFYEDSTEQLIVGKLFSSLTENKPLEFMTSRCIDLHDHELTKSQELMEMQAFGALAQSGAFLFIDAINPDGSVCSEIYERMSKINKTISSYEPFLGGESVEDVAVYFSNESKMDLRENGEKINSFESGEHDLLINRAYPHYLAIRGVCRILNRAHIPFGVISKKQLHHLSKHKLVILANVERMDQEETEAIREYVRNGGKIYASRFTSLIETKGVKHEDFMLSDVFGCHFETDNAGDETYINFDNSPEELLNAIKPQQNLSHIAHNSEKRTAGCLLLKEYSEANKLGTLTLPYGDKRGNVFDRNWISIHSSPPWRKTNRPVIVKNCYEQGICIYSAADIETIQSEANEKLFLELINILLNGEKFSFSSASHPCIWSFLFHQPEKRRYRLSLLNYQLDLPVIPIQNVKFLINVPEKKNIKNVFIAPDKEKLKFSLTDNNDLEITIPELLKLSMIVIEY